MKKLLTVLFLLLLVFIAYTDLTKGTIVHEAVLPESSSQVIEAVAEPGDSLLTMLKRHDHLPAVFSIDELSYEFSLLNNGLPPNKIIAGETYLLPVLN
ncbi:hypothetical protein [Jeotgalibacillus proteolyticus]|uniref:LysM domain-containing protein n=1 Tax=Jeotgalibacillus proteolyticus TaxID=2082395 RepID=A0A2S5GET7_9BACL|nr:hypothetical protein [Jeotgalibacillus proteolyticus]PPA71424.1 hypothetical protein C4B60_05010 [Jeotgalibacillus proteolyticus]